MKKIFFVLLCMTLCLNSKAQYFDSYRVANRTLNTYKTYGYVFKDWVQYHLDNGKAYVYRDGFPDIYHNVHISISDKVVYKNKTYKVVGIKDCAWESAYHVLSFKLPDNIEEIPAEAFHDCFSAREINMPKRLKKIAAWAFSRTRIERLCLPDSLKSINDYAFYECSSLKYIELPSTLTYIGEQAFCGCSALDTVKVKFTDPVTVERNTFFNTTPIRNVVLLVPKGTLEHFAASSGWKLFDIREY